MEISLSVQKQSFGILKKLHLLRFFKKKHNFRQLNRLQSRRKRLYHDRIQSTYTFTSSINGEHQRYIVVRGRLVLGRLNLSIQTPSEKPPLFTNSKIAWGEEASKTCRPGRTRFRNVCDASNWILKPLAKRGFFV